MMDFAKDIEEYYAREAEAIRKLDKNAINQAMNCLLSHYERETDIYVFGNGGSSATASHMVCDFGKGASMGLPKRFRFLCLNDNVPTVMAVANDIGFDDVFYYQLENKLRKEDLVIAISGSGNSRNVIKAAAYAKKVGCDVIGMTGFDGGLLGKIADYRLHVPANDMQITEDLHMSFDHMMMQIIRKALAAREEKAGKK
jgi:D-sedoheptulose 7-phosphate isomerase